MVFYRLQMYAMLSEEVKLLTCNRPDFTWLIKMDCVQCATSTDRWQHITQDVVIPVAGGHGTVNYLAKCKMCHSEMRMSIIPGSIADYKFEDSEQFKTICVFECRGAVPSRFLFGNDWVVVAKSSTVYENVNLTDDDGFWAQYDVASKEVLEISQTEYKFVKTDKP